MRTESCQPENLSHVMLQQQMVIRLTFAMIVLLILHSLTFAKPNVKSVIAKGGKPEKLAGDFKFTEAMFVLVEKTGICFSLLPQNLYMG